MKIDRKTLGKALCMIVGGLVVATGAFATREGGADDPVVATTPHFIFYSDFETNLHDALLMAGTARDRQRSELFQEGGEGHDCFAELAPSARAGWNLAVDYYAEIVSPSSTFSRQQVLLRQSRAGHDGRFDERARRFVAIGEGFQQAAAPAYAACHWAQQNAANRAWFDRLAPKLRAHQGALVPRLEALFDNSLPADRVRIDVVGHAPPVGANTMVSPPHVIIASSTADRDALEITFHEASHVLMERSDPVPVALKEAAEKAGVELPRDLWHVVLFYTAGEALRELLAAAGEPGYVPYMEHNGLWDRFWGKFRTAIEATWPAYLRGERSLEEASADLIAALPVSTDD